jgi:hypothetical protein
MPILLSRFNVPIQTGTLTRRLLVAELLLRLLSLPCPRNRHPQSPWPSETMTKMLLRHQCPGLRETMTSFTHLCSLASWMQLILLKAPPLLGHRSLSTLISLPVLFLGTEIATGIQASTAEQTPFREAMARPRDYVSRLSVSVENKAVDPSPHSSHTFR